MLTVHYHRVLCSPDAKELPILLNFPLTQSNFCCAARGAAKREGPRELGRGWRVYSRPEWCMKESVDISIVNKGWQNVSI